jgi:hypothetical protein
VGQVPNTVARKIHQPDVGSAALARRYECQGLAVRRERTLIVVRGIVGQSFDTGPVWMRTIDLRLTRALGREYDPLTVRRERGVVVRTGTREEWMPIAAISICDIELKLIQSAQAEDAFFMLVGRKRGYSKQ